MRFLSKKSNRRFTAAEGNRWDRGEGRRGFVCVRLNYIQIKKKSHNSQPVSYRQQQKGFGDERLLDSIGLALTRQEISSRETSPERNRKLMPKGAWRAEADVPSRTGSSRMVCGGEVGD